MVRKFVSCDVNLGFLFSRFKWGHTHGARGSDTPEYPMCDCPIWWSVANTKCLLASTLVVGARQLQEAALLTEEIQKRLSPLKYDMQGDVVMLQCTRLDSLKTGNCGMMN